MCDHGIIENHSVKLDPAWKPCLLTNKIQSFKNPVFFDLAVIFPPLNKFRRKQLSNKILFPARPAKPRIIGAYFFNIALSFAILFRIIDFQSHSDFYPLVI